MRLPKLPPPLSSTGETHKDVLRKIARGWMLLGILIVPFISAMAVAHYLFGEPIHDRTTGTLSTAENTLSTFLFIGGGGALFGLLGFLLNRWLRSAEDSNPEP